VGPGGGLVQKEESLAPIGNQAPVVQPVA